MISLTSEQDGDFDIGAEEVSDFGEGNKVTDVCCKRFRWCRERAVKIAYVDRWEQYLGRR